MAKTLDDLLEAVNHEWEHWGKSTWNLVSKKKNIDHKDDDDDYAEYVIENYCSVVADSPFIQDSK